MLRVGQDGRRVLVLLLIAAGCCLARPQLQPVAEKRDPSLPPSATSPGSGATSLPPDTSVFHSRQPYSDLVHSRDGHEQDDLRNGRRNQETEESISSSETPRFSKNSTATQLGQSIQTMANQLLTSHLLSDDSMVESDVRTPPKIKSQLEHKQKQSANGHGVAVPVIIEDDEDVEKTIEKLDRIGSDRVPPPVIVNKTSLVHVTSSLKSTTPSSGFSTWILLSGSNTTNQPAVTRKVKPYFSTTTKSITTRFEQSKISSPLAANNKPTTVLELTSTTTPVITRPSTYFTRIATSNPPRKTSTSKPFSAEGNNTYSQTNRTTMKPLIQTLTRRPNPVTGSKIKNQTRLDAPTLIKRRKPVTLSTTTIRPQASLPYKEESPVTVLPDYIEDSTAAVTENDDNTTTTKRTRRPGSSEKKKKKKNKNRHRRPTKKPDEITELESKVTDEDTNMSNVAATKERPLSTRIYNYLAREVMPSVGVGLLGLVFTAGLAGLIMYPFGGGAARKTYEELETSQGGYYGFSSDIDREGGMSDAEAFGKVLAGMKENHMSAYNNAGSANTVYGTHEATYGDAASRYGGGRVDSSQENGNIHSETKQQFVGSQNVPNQKYGEDYSRNKYVSSFPVYQTGGVRYRQVGIGSSYPVNHQIPETQEVTLEDKITPVAVQSDNVYGTSKTSSVQRGPIAQPLIEHGPRSLNRRKRDVFPEKNDMDNEIIPSVTKDHNKPITMNSVVKSPEIAKTDKFTESTTTNLPTEKTENSTNSFETSEASMIGVPDLQNILDMETTTDSGSSEEVTLNPTTVLSDGDNLFSSGTVPEEGGVASTTTATSSQDQFSFFGFLRQLIQFKVQLGLNILRNSSAAFTRYLDGVQKRMNVSYRNNVKRSANIQEIRNRTKLRG